MVPLRAILEALGASVEWNHDTKTVSATLGDDSLSLTVGSKTITKNESKITCDVPAQITDGRVMIPARAVAESLGAKVVWDAVSRTVIIMKVMEKDTVYLYNTAFNKYHVRTSGGSYECFDFYIDGSNLTVKGYTEDETIVEAGISFGTGEMQYVTKVNPKERFQISVDLSSKKISDETTVDIYIRKKDEETFLPYTSGSFFVECADGEYRFKESKVWENNRTYMTYWMYPYYHIDADIESELVLLSTYICKNAKNDYDKILRIYNWVADNIYYNYDCYNEESKEKIVHDALEVYKCKRTVCEGYANLTKALINAQGIPCRKVMGYSLELNQQRKYWDVGSAKTKIPNHAWNQAFVDNRWINIDTTWGSGNEYRDGKFLYKGIDNHLYFDMSDVFLSYTYKCLG